MSSSFVKLKNNVAIFWETDKKNQVTQIKVLVDVFYPKFKCPILW